MLPKLAEIKSISEFMEMIDCDLDEKGLLITDWLELVDAVRDRFPELIDDSEDI